WIAVLQGSAEPPSPGRPATHREARALTQEGGLEFHRRRAYHNLRRAEALLGSVCAGSRPLAAQQRESLPVDRADRERDAEINDGRSSYENDQGEEPRQQTSIVITGEQITGKPQGCPHGRRCEQLARHSQEQRSRCPIMSPDHENRVENTRVEPGSNR